MIKTTLKEAVSIIGEASVQTAMSTLGLSNDSLICITEGPGGHRIAAHTDALEKQLLAGERFRTQHPRLFELLAKS